MGWVYLVGIGLRRSSATGLRQDLGNEGVIFFSLGFDYAQPTGFVNYVRRPSVCAQAPEGNKKSFSPTLKGEIFY